MYKIQAKDYGYHLTFGGRIEAEEMKAWLEESKTILAAQARPFGVFVDMRTLIPITAEARVHMGEGQRLYKSKGLQRSVVILNSPVITVQFKGIAHETGIYTWERYIDASAEEEWEKIGLDWVIKGADPDAVKKEAITGIR